MLKPGRLCLLAAVLLAAPAAAQGEPALFSVWSDARGGAVLEPILVRGRDSLRAPELDDGFGAEYYRPGAAYAVSIAGVRVGTARVVRSELEGCMHYAAGVALELTAPLPLEWAGLAMSPELGARGRRWMRGATLEEAERLTATARRLFAESGVEIGEDEEIAEIGIAALEVPGWPTVLAGGFSLLRQDSIPGEELFMERLISRFLIAEVTPGGLRVAATSESRGEEDPYEAREPLDVVDVDGDGHPELIVSNTYSEYGNFSVYRRGASGWTEIYSGGGGGC